MPSGKPNKWFSSPRACLSGERAQTPDRREGSLECPGFGALAGERMLSTGRFSIHKLGDLTFDRLRNLFSGPVCRVRKAQAPGHLSGERLRHPAGERAREPRLEGGLEGWALGRENLSGWLTGKRAWIAGRFSVRKMVSGCGTFSRSLSVGGKVPGWRMDLGSELPRTPKADLRFVASYSYKFNSHRFTLNTNSNHLLIRVVRPGAGFSCQLKHRVTTPEGLIMLLFRR